MAIKGINFDRSLVQAQDDARVYDAMLGSRDRVIAIEGEDGMLEGGMQVKLNATSDGVTIAPGMAVIQGFVFILDAPLDIPVALNSGTLQIVATVDLTKINSFTGTPGLDDYVVTYNQVSIQALDTSTANALYTGDLFSATSANRKRGMKLGQVVAGAQLTVTQFDPNYEALNPHRGGTMAYRSQAHTFQVPTPTTAGNKAVDFVNGNPQVNEYLIDFVKTQQLQTGLVIRVGGYYRLTCGGTIVTYNTGKRLDMNFARKVVGAPAGSTAGVVVYRNTTIASTTAQAVQGEYVWALYPGDEISITLGGDTGATGVFKAGTNIQDLKIGLEYIGPLANTDQMNGANY